MHLAFKSSYLINIIIVFLVWQLFKASDTQNKLTNNRCLIDPNLPDAINAIKKVIEASCATKPEMSNPSVVQKVISTLRNNNSNESVAT